MCLEQEKLLKRLWDRLVLTDASLNAPQNFPMKLGLNYLIATGTLVHYSDNETS